MDPLLAVILSVPLVLVLLAAGIPVFASLGVAGFLGAIERVGNALPHPATLFAGLATGIGSALAFFAKRSNDRFLSIATGFSAGVMLYVSFVEIFFKGVEALNQAYGEYWSHWINAASFFGGIILIGLIDNLIPSAENPHETHTKGEMAPLRNPEAPRPDFDRLAADPASAAPGAHSPRTTLTPQPRRSG